MKRMLLAAGIATSIALGACSTAKQTNVNEALASLNQTNAIALQTIKSGCAIVQPTLIAASAASPQIASAAVVNGVVCATATVAADAASAVVAAQAASSVSATPASSPTAASTPLSGAAVQ